MPFLFVDHIKSHEANTITGDLLLDHESRYINDQGMVLPGIISEAVGQLASWKVINDGNYQGRPVFLFADRIEILHPVPADTKIELRAEIHSSNAETIAFSGSAHSDCRKVLTVTNCTGYFMKLSDLEDPDVAKKRFDLLTTPAGLNLDRTSPIKLDAEISGFQILDRTPTSVEAQCQLQKECSFYRDHFPRFPVTPIVVINELVGRVCQDMLSDVHPVTVNLREVTGVKIREFIKGGEPFTIRATVKEKIHLNPDHEEAKVMVQIQKNNKNILRGHYLFSIKNAAED